jgi:hypothetical protein
MRVNRQLRRVGAEVKLSKTLTVQTPADFADAVNEFKLGVIDKSPCAAQATPPSTCSCCPKT